MPFVDVKSRNEKEFSSIQREVKKLVKGLTCNTGDVFFVEHNGTFIIELENDGRVSDLLAMCVSKSNFACEIVLNEFDGWFDWKAQIYVKPMSTVTFKMK